MSLWYVLLEKQARRGSYNMAVDEYLFRLAQQKKATFLRLYTWSQPTASLGAGQDASRALKLEECAKRGVEVVRRMTGGKMVLHHLEVTYSVASSEVEIFTSTLEGSYRLISEALVRGLELMGVKAQLAEHTSSTYARSHLPCFAYPARNEVEINGKKIIGSAQKRVGNCFIQHGSIPLVKELELLAAISQGLDASRQERITSLSDELGRQVSYLEGAEYILAGFRSYFGFQAEERRLSPEELGIIREIETKKYANPRWTLERVEPELGLIF
ncbi:MAG: lipoate--protein ligase family protein [Candidatus Aminicenantes bacterium]|nr:lipoate--protein ligase family protein [Candidatus Aminicenantes bacterium]